jgi:uncharacterized protein (TIGR03435 family)
MRAPICMSVLVLLSGLAPVKAADTPPAFDIADVHTSPRTMTPRMSGGVLRGNRFEIRQATMVDLVRVAYGVDADKVLGGPSWVELDRFDVLAKAPPATAPDVVRQMLQSLLAERFNLVVRQENKPMLAFVLSLGKGKPKLKEADGSGDTGCRPQQQPGAEPGSIPYNLYVCRNVTMDAFVTMIHNFANGYLTSPTVNSTGLAGSWDFELKWTSLGLLARAGGDGITLFDAVSKQLGLKLEPQQMPQPVVQLVSVNRTPGANPPGISTALPPPPPAEFEVADIKPSAPGVNQPMLQLLPSGRLTGQGIPLKLYITLAWELNEDMIVGLPKFADTAPFDIVAKVSSLAAGAANAPQIDIDSLRLMLRALLADRFKLATHMEDRLASGYVLTAVKPKLQKADPANRTGCTQPRPGIADAKDPRIANPVLSQYIVCHNITIAQFAEQLPMLGNGYVSTPVLDATGLKDAYDFTLSFSPPFQAAGRGGGVPGPAQGAPGDAAASDPNGALSLPEAVSRQLGLKMEMQKHTMPVLVIDHIEEKPTDN